MLSPIKPAVRRARDAAGSLYGVVRHIATSWTKKALAAFLAPRMLVLKQPALTARSDSSAPRRQSEITRLRTALERIAASAGPNMSRGTSGDGHARCIHLAREALCNG
jgi:hypothetical protein